MDSIGNYIKVLFQPFSEDVKYDIKDGFMILYDCSELTDKYNKIFTGMRLWVSKDVKLLITTLENKSLDYHLEDDYIILNDLYTNLNQPVAKVYFVPVNNDSDIDVFYGMFLEVHEDWYANKPYWS